MGETSMGSLLFPIVANLYMETFERSINNSPGSTMTLDKMEAFHQHLNEQYPPMEFTVEIEKDKRIGLLNVAVTRRDGAFTTEVYRKPTDMDLRTLHFPPPTNVPQTNMMENPKPKNPMPRSPCYRACHT